jgi:hypothetical protein
VEKEHHHHHHHDPAANQIFYQKGFFHLNTNSDSSITTNRASTLSTMLSDANTNHISYTSKIKQSSFSHLTSNPTTHSHLSPSIHAFSLSSCNAAPLHPPNANTKCSQEESRPYAGETKCESVIRGRKTGTRKSAEEEIESIRTRGESDAVQSEEDMYVLVLCCVCSRYQVSLEKASEEGESPSVTRARSVRKRVLYCYR